MAGVYLKRGFHHDMRVGAAGNAAIGYYTRMLSWLSEWPDYDVVPFGLRRSRGNRVGVDNG